MRAMVLLTGLTFAGRVWEAGDICDDVEHVEGFPMESRGVSTLDPEFRDSQGRKWFRLLPDPQPVQAAEAEDAGEKDEDSAKDEPEELACRYCGKPYKSQQWLANHEEQCTMNPGE